MILTMENADALHKWMAGRIESGHIVSAIKGVPPKDATYSNGDLILREVNIGWQDMRTGEVFDIVYKT